MRTGSRHSLIMNVNNTVATQSDTHSDTLSHEKVTARQNATTDTMTIMARCTFPAHMHE